MGLIQYFVATIIWHNCLFGFVELHMYVAVVMTLIHFVGPSFATFLIYFRVRRTSLRKSDDMKPKIVLILKPALVSVHVRGFYLLTKVILR